MNANWVAKAKSAWLARPRPSYWLTRVAFLRSLAFIFVIAYINILGQFKPLLGERGLLPAGSYMKGLQAHFGGALAAFWQIPSLFWLNSSDSFSTLLAWIGLILSVAALLGATSSLVYFGIWAIYLSFVNVGQIFYGFGWESMMLESCFLAIFLCNSFKFSMFSEESPPPAVVICFLRWMLFRVMFGAGLIKLRGDACWIDLTCLQYHYETQPIPNPLSWYFHHQSFWLHKAEVVFTHFAELGVPWGYFGPRPVRHIAGLLTIFFQVMLILSGNLSWLNYLTIVIALACLDDSFFGIFFGFGRVQKIQKLLRSSAMSPALSLSRRGRRIVLTTLTVILGVFSIKPALNLISSKQIMNASFDPFHLVNTYGAFGSVQETRSEVVLSGTTDERITDDTQWVEYQFKCKPGDVMRRPCLMSPYHYRLDWLMWFAAMSDYRYHPWLVHLMAKLLEADPATLGLLADDPFKGQKPKFVRADLYQYHFTDSSDKSGAWWTRNFEVQYLPPLSRDNPSLKQYLQSMGWSF